MKLAEMFIFDATSLYLLFRVEVTLLCCCCAPFYVLINNNASDSSVFTADYVDLDSFEVFSPSHYTTNTFLECGKD